MSKNWIAWWTTTISMNIFIYLATCDQDPMRAVLMTDSLWAIATVVCLWARREKPEMASGDEL